MGSEQAGHICGVDIKAGAVSHNTDRLAAIGVGDCKAPPLVVHKPVKGNPPLGAKVEQQFRAVVQFRNHRATPLLWMSCGIPNPRWKVVSARHTSPARRGLGRLHSKSSARPGSCPSRNGPGRSTLPFVKGWRGLQSLVWKPTVRMNCSTRYLRVDARPGPAG